jgi:heme-degrading monooxygenase HmoA
MIARTWRGRAALDKAAAYQRHFAATVAPHLKEIPGHRGAYLLRREDGAQVEFVAITLWDTIETIEAFAGDDPTRAVVEPEARAALASFDEFATHFEVACAATREE